MSQPQSAIIPDHCSAAIFIEADLAGSVDAIKNACKQSLGELAALQGQYPDCKLGLTIAFGDACWKAFGHGEEGRELKPFRALGNGMAPATQHDLMMHIQSTRPDVNFSLAMAVLAAFGDNIRIADETHGFRWVEERGLDGFVDGTENPQGDDNVRSVGVIGEGADAGGSYVLLQKYRHDLKKWDKVPLAEQEAAIGRTKADNREFPREERLPDSHLGRVNLKENGVGLKIVRRSLPFGTVSGEHGLMFIAYSARLHNIDAQLLSMFGETDGKTDRILKLVTTPVTGAYYYAPGVERLQNL